MINPVVPLAELVAHTRYEDLPPRAIEAAKTFILDRWSARSTRSRDSPTCAS